MNDKNFVEIERIEINDLTKRGPIEVEPRFQGTSTVVQSDTDSVYCCFQEYREYFPDIDDVQFFYHWKLK